MDIKIPKMEGWVVFHKVKGWMSPCSVDINRSGIGLSGYIYIYPTKECAMRDCNELNATWSKPDFIVKKVKLSLTTK